MPVLGIITAAFLTVCYSVWVMHEYAKRRKEKVKKLGDSLRRLDEAVAASARENPGFWKTANLERDMEDIQRDIDDWHFYYDPAVIGNVDDQWQ